MPEEQSSLREAIARIMGTPGGDSQQAPAGIADSRDWANWGNARPVSYESWNSASPSALGTQTPTMGGAGITGHVDLSVPKRTTTTTYKGPALGTTTLPDGRIQTVSMPGTTPPPSPIRRYTGSYPVYQQPSTAYYDAMRSGPGGYANYIRSITGGGMGPVSISGIHNTSGWTPRY